MIPASAATNAAEEITVPNLAPPYAELPPTFWEQHGFQMLLLGCVALLIVALLIWLVRRSKPVVMSPPEVRARTALEVLLAKSEDGLVLSQVSRIVRDYLRAVFDLPPGELTTTEFCRVLAADEKVGSELAADVSVFLRRCDERKFSARPTVGVQASACSDTATASPDTPKRELQPAASRALELISLSEARRAQFSGSAGVVTPSSLTQSDAARRQETGVSKS